MGGLLDFLQGASNSVASNVSAPVDGLAWLLRKSGVPIPDEPIGGSDWMARNGLTAQPQNRNMGLLGEAIGGLAPMLIAAKAPQIARGLLQAEANAMAPRTLNPQTGAIVWHGSPHKFDKFDSGKIGTGEGAQAYGHGLYLAESPDVAKNYQAALGRPDGAGLTKAQDVAAWAHSQGIDGVSPVSVLSDEIARLEKYGKFGKRINRADYDEAMQILQKGQAPTNGSLYKVDLPDEHIAKMLDWDKPLSQQAQGVKQWLKDPYNAYRHKLAEVDVGGNEPTGGLIMNRLQQLMSEGKKSDAFTNSANYGAANASRELADYGIPGIRYFDEGSRVANPSGRVSGGASATIDARPTHARFYPELSGGGTYSGSRAGPATSNFVVFPGNEGLLSILERNGTRLTGP